MEKLTRAEEPVMHALWRLKKAFVRDIIEFMTEPKPPYNTISSIVRILEEKGMVSYEAFGKTHRYFPIISKNEYRAEMVKKLIHEYFDGSHTMLVSQIICDKDITKEELEQLTDLTNQLTKN